MVHSSDTKIGGAGREFPVTDWSSLLHLRDPGDPAYARTLNRLAERYWKPAYHYVRALRRASVEEAKDLTQQFFAMLLSRGDLARLSRERGSFRGFLKAALRNFLVSAYRARKARLPREGVHLLHLAWDDTREELREPPSPGEDPARVFDREWARGVLLDAVRSLESVLAADGKRLHYDIFREYCRIPEGEGSSLDATRRFFCPAGPSPTYADLAARYGIRQSDVRNYLHACRRRLRQILCASIRGYVAHEEEVEAELRFLLSP
ncbi:MAG: sigma-70 family RNA polymerase sigma factor [Planctomycetes bacterium]|nr:sigma-70 family RNA polymerase sigma factor [Planctomycetota bacterium]